MVFREEKKGEKYDLHINKFNRYLLHGASQVIMKNKRHISGPLCHIFMILLPLPVQFSSGCVPKIERTNKCIPIYPSNRNIHISLFEIDELPLKWGNMLESFPFPYSTKHKKEHDRSQFKCLISFIKIASIRSECWSFNTSTVCMNRSSLHPHR